MNWENIGQLVAVLSPLVGAPLIVITLYLRAIRETQTHGMGELTHRIQTIEGAIHDLLKATGEFEREYTTKEEWVRESIFSRQRLEKLTEIVTRIQSDLENGHGVAAELGRVAAALARIAQRCVAETALAEPCPAINPSPSTRRESAGRNP